MYRGTNIFFLNDEKKKFYPQVLDPVDQWTGNVFLFKDGLRCVGIPKHNYERFIATGWGWPQRRADCGRTGLLRAGRASQRDRHHHEGCSDRSWGTLDSLTSSDLTSLLASSAVTSLSLTSFLASSGLTSFLVSLPLTFPQTS